MYCYASTAFLGLTTIIYRDLHIRFERSCVHIWEWTFIKREAGSHCIWNDLKTDDTHGHKSTMSLYSIMEWMEIANVYVVFSLCMIHHQKSTRNTEELEENLV